jgi:hypothetical protein
VHARADRSLDRREAAEHAGFRRVRVHDVGTQALELSAQRTQVRRVVERRERPHHRKPRDAHARALEPYQIVLELGLAQRRRDDVDVESRAPKPERRIDEVPARAADRALHHVQHAHDQYAPVPLTTAKPVSAMITTSSRNDWFSM